MGLFTKIFGTRISACIAAAEAEHADLQKAQKKLPVNHLFFSFLFRIRVLTTPSTIQKITT